MRTLLCASALGAGTALSALTDGHAELVSTAHAANDLPADPIARRPLAADSVELDAPIPTPLDHDPVATDPFGASLARGRIITGASRRRLLLFTFDDGPHQTHTPKLLDYLDAYGVRGVFFLTGSRLRGTTPRERQLQRIAREIVARGHMVASHTLDHVQLPTLNDVGVREQLDVTEQAFVDVLGARPWLIRVPGGSRSVRVDNMIASRGYTQVLWNLGTGDFQVGAPEDVFTTWQRVLEVRERDTGDRGGIILLHDIHAHAVEAFPLIIEEIRRRNCALYEAGEELYDIVDDPRFFFEARGGASPSALAGPARIPERDLEARQAVLREETRQRCELAVLR